MTAVNDIHVVRLLGVSIHSTPLKRVLSHISDSIQQGHRSIISNVNVHAMNIAYQEARFRRFLNEDSDLVFCDGMGVRLGARMTGQHIDYRYTPPDWIDDLCQVCVENDFSLFLLGSRKQVVEEAAASLKDRFPTLKIAGTQDGFFDKDPNSTENKAVVETINATNPDILLVAFGMPMQEYWLEENWDRLNARIALPVGALFDYITGEVLRAPRWITDNGLEWLARLVIEPRRLWRRYVIGNPLFIYRVLRNGKAAP